MDTEQFKYVASRTLEIMGGREAAITSMEAEFEAMKKRWDQDTDTIGRILRAHLHVEHYLTEHLQTANPNLGEIDSARLSFAQKVELLKSDAGTIDMIVGGVRHLNRIRNRLAHNLSAGVTEDDAGVFLSQEIFAAMRQAKVKDSNIQPSTNPLDVLEDFAEFASAMFHNASTPYGKAFDQAMIEWLEKHGA
ncbi:hypothetical protein [Cupriavidus sp. UYPR2.512]|uniref:hypothetical protein n=1 Tax=Cupriavidus sp. UYPR2.512 TaxID=1080187 RepID=UPI00037E4259|nr:hypothetical protein [Cupriavidus sp. UYPR2.512]UIF86088.1 hypothetical protein KAF44_19040 [Cupriavidus necator]